MPNYVTNIVNIIGPSEQREKLLEQIAFDGRPGTFDFNKVIPMPDGLNLTEGGIAEHAIDAYLSAMNPNNDSKLIPKEKLTAEEFLSVVQDARASRRFYSPNIQLDDKQIIEIAGRSEAKTPDSLIRMGRQYLTNYREHGASTWYGWSTKRWGTKWNNDPEHRVIDDATGNLCFDTAWATPKPIFTELSRQYPELTFDVSWADEDIGYNVGTREYRNGEVVSEYIPDFGTPEAEEMAFDIKGFDEGAITIDPVELGSLIEEAQGRLESKQQDSPDKPHPPKQKNELDR